jgi:regulator of ribonuclease activity B
MKRSAALVVIALIGGCARTEVRGDPSSPAPAPHGSRDTVDAMDQGVIAQLKRNGSDVTKPTDVVHYLYIPSHRDAEEASRRSVAAGYRAAVHEPLGKLPNGTTETRYSVEAQKTTVPSIENIRRARAFFNALARRFGGEYDGWEAAVVK